MSETMNASLELRPWWFVRWELLMVLTVLIAVLAAILLEPDLVDRGLSIAGI